MQRFAYTKPSAKVNEQLPAVNPFQSSPDIVSLFQSVDLSNTTNHPVADKVNLSPKPKPPIVFIFQATHELIRSHLSVFLCTCWSNAICGCKQFPHKDRLD